MKKILFQYIALIILLSSCSTQLSDESVVGRWKTTEFSSTCDLSPTIIFSAKMIALSGIYDILQGGDLIFTDPQYKNGRKGNWTLYADQNIIQFNFDDSQANPAAQFDIQSFSERKMELSEKVGDLGENFYTFEKE